MIAREGSRPMLIEVQALTDETQGMNPRRVAVGLESNRLALLLAVLHRHGGVSSAGRDVFVNVVGGVRIGVAGDMTLGEGSSPPANGARKRDRRTDNQDGEIGIDGLAGPSEILVIADDSADPELVAADKLHPSAKQYAEWVKVMLSSSERALSR